MNTSEIRALIRPGYSFREVHELQRLPLRDKIELSVEVLREAYRRHDPRHRVAVAFSGGKDSQVVSDLIERYLPERFGETHCIFGNTGIEFPESLRFAREYGAEHYGERFHETKLQRLPEAELRYTFARELIAQLEDEGALHEVLKSDGRLKGQKALVQAAQKRGYTLDRTNCYFAGHPMNFAYCIEQYGAPLLGKAASKLDAHRINIECFLKYSEPDTDREETRAYYDVLRQCKFSQHCCKLLKKEPSERLQAELGVDMIVKGLMAFESRSRMVSISTRGHIFASHRDHIPGGDFLHVSPIAMWTDDDIWAYIRMHELRYSPLYDIAYTGEDGSQQRIRRNGCMMCGTDIQFRDNHLAALRQTHPKAWRSCMEHFGYAEELYKLFRIRKDKNILSAFTDEGTKARLIERFGGMKNLLESRPCAYDEFGELVDLTGTGLDAEYDAEVILEPSGQLRLI